MATSIKPTLILTGADSRQFAKAMENVLKISPKKREEQFKAYEWFKRAAQFPEDEDTRAMYFDLKAI